MEISQGMMQRMCLSVATTLELLTGLIFIELSMSDGMRNQVNLNNRRAPKLLNLISTDLPDSTGGACTFFENKKLKYFVFNPSNLI